MTNVSEKLDAFQTIILREIFFGSNDEPCDKRVAKRILEFADSMEERGSFDWCRMVSIGYSTVSEIYGKVIMIV